MSPHAEQEVWTIQRILAWTEQHFAQKGIASPRLDAEVLLADTLGVGRIYLYTHHDKPMHEAERAAYRERVKRRAAGEPVAYILGHREFYSRDLKVTRDVLIPRPETEHLVDAVIDWVRAKGVAEPKILEIGTGSGAIAIALAAEIEGAHVVATDVSSAALDIARENLAKHGLARRVELKQGDLFEPVAEMRGVFDVVVSNPPYVDIATRDTLPIEVRGYEPEVALFAEAGGLAVIRRLCREAGGFLKMPGLLAFEMGFDQRQAVFELLDELGGWAEPGIVRDLQGHARVLLAEWR